MKIGDRVVYAEENPALEGVQGIVVEPTMEELEEAKGYEGIRPELVRVTWDDGFHFWEHPSHLRVVEEAGA